MRYEITFSPAAIDHYDDLDAHYRAIVRDGIETHLRHEPEKVSKSRIKRLEDLTQPQFRLRIGDYRIFYDVEEGNVNIFAIVPKANADDWLQHHGVI